MGNSLIPTPPKVVVFFKVSMQTFQLFYFAGLFQGMSTEKVGIYHLCNIFIFSVCTYVLCLLTYHFPVCEEKVMKIIKLRLSILAFHWEKWFEESVIHQLVKDSLSWIYMKRGRSAPNILSCRRFM